MTIPDLKHWSSVDLLVAYVALTHNRHIEFAEREKAELNAIVQEIRDRKEARNHV